MQLFPTASGEFGAEITQVMLNELWMQRFSEKFSARCHRRGSARSQGIHLSHRRSARGTQPRQGFHVRRNLRGRLRSTARKNVRLGGASLEPEAFAAACKGLVGCEIDTERGERFIRPNPDLLKRILQLHETVGSIARITPELFKFPNV
jgi:hypothetical protein